MRVAFADTFYFLALLDSSDSHHAKAGRNWFNGLVTFLLTVSCYRKSKAEHEFTRFEITNAQFEH